MLTLLTTLSMIFIYMKYNKYHWIILVACFIFLISCHAIFQKSDIKKSSPKIAKGYTPQGIIGRVLVFDSPSRTEEITNISSIQKIYCRAYPYPKAAKKVGSETKYRIGLWQGSNCSFTERTTCKNFYFDEGNIHPSEWLHQEYIDFEINIKKIKNSLTKDSDRIPFYIMLSGGMRFEQCLSISFPLDHTKSKNTEHILNSISTSKIKNN